MSVDAPARPAHRDANALRWVTGYLSSLIGDQVWFVALGWAAVQAGSAAQVGGVLAAGALPRAVLLLFGGALADRWGPRRTALGSDAVRTALLLCGAAAVLLLPPSVLVLVVLAGAFGAVDAVYLPAASAMPPQLVAPDQVLRLTGMRGTVQRLATTLGAPAGGLVVAAAGAGVGLALAAGATALSVLALLTTRVRPVEPVQRQPLLRQVRAGLAHAARSRVLRPLLLLAAVSEFAFSGALNVGVPLLAAGRGWGAAGVGVLLGALGGGATVGTLGLVLVRRVPHVGRLFLPLVVLMGAALVALALVPSLLAAAALAAVVGAGGGASGSLFGALLLTLSPPDMVARVSSLAMLAFFGLAPVAYALAGVAASVAGPSAPFVLGGGVCVLAGALALAPALRRVELPA